MELLSFHHAPGTAVMPILRGKNSAQTEGPKWLFAAYPLRTGCCALLALAMALLLPKLGYVSPDRSVTAIGLSLGFTVELPLC